MSFKGLTEAGSELRVGSAGYGCPAMCPTAVAGMVRMRLRRTAMLDMLNERLCTMDSLSLCATREMQGLTAQPVVDDRF